MGKYCTECGAKINTEYKFCACCGTEIIRNEIGSPQKDENLSHTSTKVEDADSAFRNKMNFETNLEKTEFDSFLDARGVIFENLIPTDNNYPKCVFGTDYNRGIGNNLIQYDEDYTFLIKCLDDDEGAPGIKAIYLDEEDEFDHFVREEMFTMIFSMINNTGNKFQIIAGGFFPEEDKKWYDASDIKSRYKNL